MSGAPGWIPMGGNGSDTRGAMRPGRGGGRCGPCDNDDRRLDYIHNHQRAHGRGGPRGYVSRSSSMPGSEHWRRHHWLWLPKTRHWTHIEPADGIEVAPGRLVKVIKRLVPAGMLPHGWPRMHFTPANFLLHHGPPPAVPMGERGGVRVIRAPSAHVPGHYGWSPVLHKHVWIGAHTKGPAVNPASLPPAAREAFDHQAKLSAQHATNYAHAHTFWGASGARTSVIPGHWQWSASKHEWCYIEPHTDSTGRPTTIAYDTAHAPPAAFGARPSYLPALFFWPDSRGFLRDAHMRQPTGAAISIPIPSHVAFAASHGLLDPGLSRQVLGNPGGSSPMRAINAARQANAIARTQRLIGNSTGGL